MDTNKVKLVVLLVIVALPISLATWMFNRSLQQGVGATSNNGVLIQPVLDVTDLDMRDREGALIFRTFEQEVAGIDPDQYQPRPWLLVYLGGPRCGQVCEQRLYYLRQLHRRLGPDESRVLRYYLVAGEGRPALDAAARALFDQRFAQMRLAWGDAEVIRGNLARTLSDASADPIRDHYIYVVDPVGNVMLYFTPDNTPEDILSDLQTLLDQSSLG